MKSILSCAMLATLAIADTLHLKDGRELSGTFVSGTSREVRFLAKDTKTASRFALSRIQSIEFGQAAATTGDRARLRESAVPAGGVITVRMIDSIDSNSANAGETFRASLEEPIVIGERTLVPKGADAIVKVVKVDESGRLSGREEVALELVEISANGKRHATVTQHAQVSAKAKGEENLKIVGGTAVVGAIIGAIAGGGKGAAIGAAAGAGAGAAAQAIRGQRVQIPSESRLDFTLSEPLIIE